MSSFRSLVVTRLSPFPPGAGVPLRVAGNLRALAELGPVDVLVINDEVDPDDIPSHVDRVSAIEVDSAPRGRFSRTLAKLGKTHPLARSLFGSDVEDEIDRLGRGPGIVVLDEVWLAPYLPAAHRTGRKVIYDSHNVETVLRRAIAAGRRDGWKSRLVEEVIARQVRRLERDLVTRADQIWVCSELDREGLADLFGESKPMVVVPNTVKTADADPGGSMSSSIAPSDEPVIMYLGDLGYGPNEDGALFLLEDVFPVILMSHPTAHVLIVGRRPTEPVQEAARQLGSSATVTGEVDTVAPYLRRCDVLVVTLRIGGGTRLKILEGLMAGKPVVTTKKGLEGLELNHGDHVLVADDAASIAAAVVSVIEDPEGARRMAERGRSTVEGKYHWKSLQPVIAHAVGSLNMQPSGHRQSEDAGDEAG